MPRLGEVSEKTRDFMGLDEWGRFKRAESLLGTTMNYLDKVSKRR